MASPFRIFRKHQKAFLVVAGVLAMFIFVFADLFTSYISQPPGRSGNEVVTSWKSGSLTVRGHLTVLGSPEGASTVEAEGPFGVFAVDTDFFPRARGQLSLQDLAIRGGVRLRGGGVAAYDGDVELQNSPSGKHRVREMVVG